MGVQLWVNLPQKDKMVDPAYSDISADMITKVAEDGVMVKGIAGTYAGQMGAIEKSYVAVRLLDVEIEPNREWTLQGDPENALFCYVFTGDAAFGEKQVVVGPSSLALMEEGETLVAKSGGEGVRFLVAEGPPLDEEIAWGGPIVMNTREEIHQAFKELEEGTFIKKRDS